MTASLLVSVAVVLVTTAAATLWAILVSTGMGSTPDASSNERPDIRTW